MNLYELRDRLSRIIDQNKQAGRSECNHLQVAVEIRQPKTPTGRYRDPVRINPVDLVSSARFTDRLGRESGATIIVDAEDADRNPKGVWYEDPAPTLGRRQKLVLTMLRDDFGRAKPGRFFEGDHELLGESWDATRELLESLHDRGLARELDEKPLWWELTGEGAELAEKLT